jgi:phosphatidylglycerophosphate synthase
MRYGCVVFADAPQALVEIAGISVLERLLRTLQRCGLRDAVIVSQSITAVEPSSARRELRCHFTSDANAIVYLAPDAQMFLIVRGDTIFDPRLLQWLLAQEREVALSNDAAAIMKNPTRDFSGLTKIDINTLPQYSPALRRSLRPYCFPVATTPALQIEKALIDATQKGALDFPAMLHAPVEKFLAARLSRTRVTPHLLTFVWIVLGFATLIFFVRGQLAWGIGLAFIIGILDGLDGKLARLRVETSRVGAIEHHFDSFFEVGWPCALAYHFVRSGELPNAFVYLALLIAMQIIDGLAKGAIYRAFAQMQREPNLLDRVLRFFGGRRNVFIWILLVALICGAPAKGLIAMAFCQTATAIVDLIQVTRLRQAR